MELAPKPAPGETTMPQHPAIAPDRAAVITGGASGIGLAAAQRFAELGMKICLADINAEALEAAAETIRRAGGEVIAVTTDVSDAEQVKRLKDKAFEAFGDVSIVMNNAAREGGGGLFADPQRWRDTLATNLWGVINGVQTFGPVLIEQGKPAAIVNTGSKQGITNPPGNPGYNATKAAVKALTESLQHALRNTPGCQVTAHLLIPGYTYTGLTGDRGGPIPQAAWTPDQVVQEMLRVLDEGGFYVLCPDNETTPAIDAKRFAWGAQDLTLGRSALSRWDPAYEDAFAAYMGKD
jgi:NAD(P)-dependent dehydrogenase (short-subunit alcohol dehydrogenase family)